MSRSPNCGPIPRSPRLSGFDFGAEWFSALLVLERQTRKEPQHAPAGLARISARIPERPTPDAGLANRLRVPEPDGSRGAGDDRLQERFDDHHAGVDLDRARAAADEAFRGSVRVRGGRARRAGGL